MHWSVVMQEFYALVSSGLVDEGTLPLAMGIDQARTGPFTPRSPAPVRSSVEALGIQVGKRLAHQRSPVRQGAGAIGEVRDDIAPVQALTRHREELQKIVVNKGWDHK